MTSLSLEPASCPCKRLPLCLSSFTSAEYGDVQGLSRHGLKQLARRVDPLTGDTPLHLAAQHGQVAATALLLQSGCGVNGSDKSLCTPLHRASFSGAVATMQLLVNEIDCDLLAIDTSFGDRMTPLHKAAAGGRFMAVQLLMEALHSRGLHETALNMKDMTNKTPLEVAMERLDHTDEAMASVARWNEVAGDKPNFEKCAQLLLSRRSNTRAPLQQYGANNTLSLKDCLHCDDHGCRVAAWETSFRSAFFRSTQDAQVIRVAPRTESQPISTFEAHQKSGFNCMSQASQKDATSAAKTATLAGNLGSCCDLCKVICFAVYLRNGRSVCNACRRKS